MSVYSQIEVLKPGQESQYYQDLYMSFGHGIGWWHQIAVARGKRTYSGVVHSGNLELEQLEDTQAMSIYELPITESLKNYQAVMKTFNSVLELGQIHPQVHLNNKFYHDLGILIEAKRWFEIASAKLPKGIVKLDWSEAVWGESLEYLEQWDAPNDAYRYFMKLTKDCKKVKQGKLNFYKFEEEYEDYTQIDQIVVGESSLKFPF